MARTDRDSWDLASSVGATATMVAAARAAASRRPDPVINDPFAEPLVRAVGLDLFTRVASGELDFGDVDDGAGFPRMVDTFAARARFYDDYFAAGQQRGPAPGGDRGVGAGRPPIPAFLAGGDHAVRNRSARGHRVQDHDTVRTRRGHRWREHRPIGIDLREDWPAALQTRGLRCRPTDGVAGRGRAHRIPAARGRSSVAGQRHRASAPRAADSPRTTDRCAARPRTAAASPDHDRPLARTRPGPAHPRLDLSRRAHRRRGPPAGARVDTATSCSPTCSTRPGWRRWSPKRRQARLPRSALSGRPGGRCSASRMLGEPLGLHRQQSHRRQLRCARVEFAITLVDVDDDALSVQPARVLAEVDAVDGLDERRPLARGQHRLARRRGRDTHVPREFRPHRSTGPWPGTTVVARCKRSSRHRPRPSWRWTGPHDRRATR